MALRLDLLLLVGPDDTARSAGFVAAAGISASLPASISRPMKRWRLAQVGQRRAREAAVDQRIQTATGFGRVEHAAPTARAWPPATDTALAGRPACQSVRRVEARPTPRACPAGSAGLRGSRASSIHWAHALGAEPGFVGAGSGPMGSSGVSVDHARTSPTASTSTGRACR